ncbi:uncharacterized protein LOC131672932 [Phymastichus coffea]|uniref:uncharacterized protein LOC131672932 n=1 Tax=Phymastichus coffea TaxID=108790 RepID=UPI00273AB886|nr:uncharacterized protein LOC131672932 [Phymastichus coffea]
MTLTILQCNVNRSSVAHMLLPQIAMKMNADVLVISEQYRKRPEPSWFASKSNTTAVWVRGNEAMRVSASGSGADYIWVRVSTVVVVSVYLSPNYSALEYANRLTDIEDAVRDISGNTIVAGDFNSRAIEWGLPTTNRRGRLLLEMVARLQLVVVNEGKSATFRRPEWGQSIPNVTLTTDRLLTRIRGWKVIEEYTASDHQYIIFEVTDENTTRRRGNVLLPLRWDTKLLDRKKLDRLLQNAEPFTKTT